jgi:hypothetical protein
MAMDQQDHAPIRPIGTANEWVRGGPCFGEQSEDVGLQNARRVFNEDIEIVMLTFDKIWSLAHYDRYLCPMTIDHVVMEDSAVPEHVVMEDPTCQRLTEWIGHS